MKASQESAPQTSPRKRGKRGIVTFLGRKVLADRLEERGGGNTAPDGHSPVAANPLLQERKIQIDREIKKGRGTLGANKKGPLRGDPALSRSRVQKRKAPPTHGHKKKKKTAVPVLKKTRVCFQNSTLDFPTRQDGKKKRAQDGEEDLSSHEK